MVNFQFLHLNTPYRVSSTIFKTHLESNLSWTKSWRKRNFKKSDWLFKRLGTRKDWGIPKIPLLLRQQEEEKKKEQKDTNIKTEFQSHYNSEKKGKVYIIHSLEIHTFEPVEIYSFSSFVHLKRIKNIDYLLFKVRCYTSHFFPFCAQSL